MHTQATLTAALSQEILKELDKKFITATCTLLVHYGELISELMGKYFMLNDLANKREYLLEIKQKSQVFHCHRDSTKDIHIKDWQQLLLPS